MYRTLLLISLFAIISCGCGKPYVPKEMSAEDAAIKDEYSKYAAELRRAMGESGNYVQVAVVDRATTFPDDENEYTRVLVLHREQLDLDDYGFSPVGKEASEADEDYLDGFFNDIMFWTNAEGDITIDDYDQPPGTEMVVEWCIKNGPENQVSLHFGGNPCLVIDLDAK